MFKKANYYLVSLIIIVCFVYVRWFLFKPSAGGDWHYYYPQALKDAFMHFTWIASYGLGDIDLLLWRLPIDLFKLLMGSLGFDSSISDKLIVFLPSVFLGIISSFFLTRKVTNSNIAGFFGALVFNFNTYFLTANSSYLIYGATSWFIFSLLAFIKALETKRYAYALLAGILLLVSSGYDFRIAYIGIFINFSYFIFFTFRFKNKSFKNNALLFFTSLFSFVILSIFWILPMIMLGSLTSNAILSRNLFGNEFLNILYAYTLYHPFWTGNSPVYFHPQQIMLYFWIIPIFAFLSLYLNRDNKNVIFFGIIALLGIFLTKQVGQPFSGAYPWLFHYVPGFNAFREASKFYFLIGLGYSVLIGAFINWIWQFIKKSKNKQYIKYFITFIILFIFLWNLKPVMTGVISGIYVNREIPNGYKYFSTYISENQNYYRTLWIPNHSKWLFYSNSHPIIGLQNLLDENWKPLNSNKKLMGRVAGEEMIDFLNMSFADNILNAASVRYLVIPYDDAENDVNIFQYYGKDRQYYINELDKIKYLNKINIGTDEVVVYENKSFRPHIYITEDKEIIKKDIAYNKINFSFLDPTRYEIQLKGVKDSFYLNFSENFHPQWKIRIGSFSWLDVILEKDYFISDKMHFKNDATLNSYFLDPILICKEFICKNNSNGTYDINMNLYFAPQSYMYLGLIISSFTAALIISYVIYFFSKKTDEKRN